MEYSEDNTARSTTDRPTTEYRPCPNCDGWLMTEGKEIDAQDIGWVTVAYTFGCWTCGHRERDDVDPRVDPPRGDKRTRTVLAV
jgi:hypothetical protein